MWVRRFWLAGLLALAAASLASAQDNSTVAAAEGGEENKEEEPEVETKPPLTGNPQIDYKYDPNLPHEVIGYDLSDYPFYSKLPKDLLDPKFNFTCDDRHDGFYASVPHKCQVYHNCLFGVRYDFLCANYTVFDQKNFICHYVSEVDCVNSEKHFDRNDALYVTTTTSTTPRPAPQIIYVQRPPPLKRRPRPNRVRPFQDKRNKGKRRTTTTMPPPPFYEYDYDYYTDTYPDYYIDYSNEWTATTTTQRPRRRPGGRPNRQRGDNRPGGGDGPFNQGYRKRPEFEPQNDGGNAPRASRLRQASAPREQIFDDARGEAPQVLPQETRTGGRPRRPGRLGQNSGQRRKKLTTTTTTEAYPDYYDYYEYDYLDDKTATTTTTAAPTGRRSRPRNRPGSSGQRARQGRPETEAPTPTTTTTEAPPADEQPSGGNRARITSRGSSRRNPVVISRRVAQAEPEEVAPDAPQNSRQRPQRLGPQFPRRRPQGGGGGGGEVEIIEEEAPLAPEVNLSPERIRGDATTAEELPRLRRPRPSRQGSDQRPSGRRRARPRVPATDYYDY